MGNMLADIEKDLSDIKTATKVAFLMYYINGVENLDEVQAMHIIDSLRHISRGEVFSHGALLPAEVLPHLVFKFSDGIIRRYTETNGFVKI